MGQVYATHCIEEDIGITLTGFASGNDVDNIEVLELHFFGVKYDPKDFPKQIVKDLYILAIHANLEWGNS